MQNIFRTGIVALSFLMLVSCKAQDEQAQTVQPQSASEKNVDGAAAPTILPATDQHSSETSLDWAGIYRGTLPCADCEGIVTVVVLNKDHSFAFYTRYLGEQEIGDEVKGDFVWSEDGNQVILNMRNPNRFQVGENRLFVLDMDGNRIDGNLAEHYILTKVPDIAIAEQYWKLVSLNGTPVKTYTRDAYITLKKDDGRVIGSGGCNRISGTYTLTDPDRIEFSALATTEMACAEGMDVEQQFVAAMAQVGFYLINGDILILYGHDKADEIARFEAVYLY